MPLSATRSICFSGFLKQKLAFGLLFLYTICSRGQTLKPEYVLSQRVGEEIDSVEAEYFNIFPDLDGVKSAVYRLDNFGNLRMLISLATGRDTTLTFSKLAALELGKYIDNHEILADSTRLIDWGLLPAYHLNRINYFEDHGSMVEIRTDTGFFAGKLMRVTDSSVILWMSEQPFKPNTWLLYSRKVMVRDIVQIKRMQDLTGKLFGLTMGTGLGIALVANYIGFDKNLFTEWTSEDLKYSLIAVGGGALSGILFGKAYDYFSRKSRRYKVDKSLDSFQKFKPALEKRAIFRKIYPPELRSL